MDAKSDQDKHATVGDRFATSESAYTIFRQLLPAKWIIRPQTPDFHIDYLIEPTEAGELTGINAAVQLKGWVPKENRGGNPTYQLKTKHLLYYLEKCELPVFLVLIDVTNRRAYWVFTQQFGHALSHDMLRKRKRILVRFQPQDTVADTPRFMQAILDSVKFLRELRPSSIEAALSQRKKELEAKDHRVEVQVDMIGGHQSIILSPKEEFPFTMSFNTKDPKTIKSVRDFLEKGTDLSIRRDEIEFKGSPLFDEIATNKDEKLLIQHRKDVEGHVLLSWGETDAESQAYVPGKFRLGLKYLSFDGQLPGSLLQVATSIPWTVASTPEPFSVSMSFQLNKWQGQRVVVLPYFESIYGLLKAGLSGKDIILRFYVQGNSLGASRMSDNGFEAFESAMSLLETLSRARALAKHFKIDPVIPVFSPAIERDLDVIDELHAKLFSNERRIPTPNVKISFKAFSPAGGEPLDPRIGPLRRVDPVREYRFFGQLVHLGPIQTQFTQLRLVRQVPLPKPGWFKLELVGTKSCVRIVQHKGVVY